MSTKFEQLLDYIVNEEMDKANELFHEIVVEKSREIYESLIEQEEEQQDESMNPDEEEQQDESMNPDEEEQQDESMNPDEEEQQDEGYEVEDSYEMEDDDESMPMKDKTDDALADIEVDGEEGDEEGGDEESAINDIRDAIAELEAAFQELEMAKGSGGSDSEMDLDSKMPGKDDEMEMMGLREYRETVAKPSGDVAGANTGEKMSAAGATKSPISSGSKKPVSGAGPIHAKSDNANEDGQKPHGKVGGVVKQGGKFVGNNTHNVDNVKSGVKTLSKVSKPADAEGHAAGAGSGDNSVKGATNTKSPLHHIS